MCKKMAIYILFIWGFIFASSIVEVNGDQTKFDLQQINSSVVNVKITTGDIITFTETVEEAEYTRLSLPGFHLSYDTGEPELPEIHRLIEIPQGAIPRIEIISQEY